MFADILFLSNSWLKEIGLCLNDFLRKNLLFIHYGEIRDPKGTMFVEITPFSIDVRTIFYF